MEGWKLLGKCVGQDLDLFFPPKNSNYRDPRLVQALDICSSCEVRGQCMDYALRYDEVGIWGGTTEAQRKKIKNRYVRKTAQTLAYRPLVG